MDLPLEPLDTIATHSNCREKFGHAILSCPSRQRNLSLFEKPVSEAYRFVNIKTMAGRGVQNAHR